MTNVHQEIVNEILKEYSDKQHVIGIWVFGSVAGGKERPDSDVDLTIIYDDDREWELFREERYGIKVDLEIIPKNAVELLLIDYPYLADFVNVKIILDKTGFLQETVDRLKKYYSIHPEIEKFWNGEYQKMRESKEGSEKPRHIISVYDEAEIKFSEHHSVKRKILTKEFFNKHIGKK